MAKQKIVSRKKASPIVPNFETEREVALDFAADVHKKFNNLIKATILFGSQAKNTAKPSSDIDVIIIIDDASVEWDIELIAWYREELGKLIASKPRTRDLHVNTVKLTAWWNDLINGDPVVINILRYGEALLDIGGFFKPLKILLQQGKIKSTSESVYAALQRAPAHLARSRMAELGAIEGVYWAMVDCAQAALITAGVSPPSPEQIPQMLKETFVDRNMLKQEYSNWFRDIYALHKSISHGYVTKIKGSEIDAWQARAEQFISQITNIIDKLIDKK